MSLMKTAIDFKPEVKLAMEQIFGRKLLCRDFDTATRFASECNMDALTMHGDQVNRNGALEGGYHDDRQSKLGSYNGIVEAKSKLNELNDQHDGLQEKCNETDQAVAHLLGSIQKDEAKRGNLRQVATQTTKDMALLKEDQTRQEDQLQAQRDLLPTMQVLGWVFAREERGGEGRGGGRRASRATQRLPG